MYQWRKACSRNVIQEASTPTRQPIHVNGPDGQTWIIHELVGQDQQAVSLLAFGNVGDVPILHLGAPGRVLRTGRLAQEASDGPRRRRATNRQTGLGELDSV